MRVALQQAGWLKHPRVHVHASNGPASPKLTALVTKLGGELMPYAGELTTASISHSYRLASPNAAMHWIAQRSTSKGRCA